MAYIPPHKRHSAGEGAALTPESMAPDFRPHSGKNHRKWFPNLFINAPNATSKWFPVGLGSCFGYSDGDADKFMYFTKLEPVSSEATAEKMFGAKPHALVLDHDRINEYDGERGVVLENPWDFIADKVKQDLFSAIQRVQEKMNENDLELIKPSLVARFGRVIFKGASSTLSDLKQVFDTNIVSPSFVEHVIDEVFSKLINDVELQKEYYIVQLSQNMESKSTISCKCILAKDGDLQLYKIESRKERYFISDMSCLGKRQDIRLILVTKNTDNNLTDDEMKCIRSLISTAVVDPGVKGGLRWPVGRNSSGDRYTVVAAWHVKTTIGKNPSIKLKVRNADRFHFESSLAEVSREVYMKIDVKSQLQMQPMQEDLFIDTLRNNLKLIWNNFVCSPSTP